MGLMEQIIAEKIAERRNSVQKDWQAFLNDPLPRLIAEVVERSNADLPDWYVAWAPGIAVASDHLLRTANYCPGSRRSSGWTRGAPDVFSKGVHLNRLTVRRCGKFWTVECEIDEVLVFTYGSMPIFGRTKEAAMRLAVYRHPDPQVPGLLWFVATPDGIRYC